jgi:O-antigen/teichoic acid export membrane protein
LAKLYDHPMIFAVLPVAGLAALINGFNSTTLLTWSRHLKLSRVITIEVISQLFAMGTAILLAIQFHSIWALITGGVMASLAKCLLSYSGKAEITHRFYLDPSSTSELFRFGKWVLISAIMSFGATQLDSLVLGYLVTLSTLGVFAVATSIVKGIVEISRNLSTRVFFPTLSGIIRDQPHTLYNQLKRIRFYIMAPTVTILIFFSFFGEQIVETLYPPNFWEAGWPLRLLSAGSIAGAINLSMSCVWLPLGASRYTVYLMSIQIPLTFVLMLGGYTLFGPTGCVLGIASVELCMYPIHAAFLAARDLWQPMIDLPLLAIAYGMIALAFI